jgi:hypothetical protein
LANIPATSRSFACTDIAPIQHHISVANHTARFIAAPTPHNFLALTEITDHRGPHRVTNNHPFGGSINLSGH